MSKTKISVLTKIAIVLTIIGSISIIPVTYMNAIPVGFFGMGGLICIFAFLFGIGGIIAAIKNRNKIINETSIRNKNISGIVICIICLLLNIFYIHSLPSIGSAREPARRISCRSSIKQIYLALKQYSMDYSGNLPPANGAAGLEYLRKYDYMTDYAVYICPSTMTRKGTGTQPLTEDIVDYVYIGGLNEKSDPNSIILYDKASNHEFFGNVAKSGGVIEGIYGKPWTEKIKK